MDVPGCGAMYAEDGWMSALSSLIDNHFKTTVRLEVIKSFMYTTFLISFQGNNTFVAEYDNPYFGRWLAFFIEVC